MHFLLLLVTSFVYFVSAVDATPRGNNNIQEFENALVTSPKIYNQCFKKLLCTAFSPSNSKKMAIQNEIEESVLEMTRQLEALPEETQQQMTNTNQIVSSFKKIKSGIIVDCDSEFSLRFTGEVDLFRFQGAVQEIYDQITSSLLSEGILLNNNTQEFHERNTNASGETLMSELIQQIIDEMNNGSLSLENKIFSGEVQDFNGRNTNDFEDSATSALVQVIIDEMTNNSLRLEDIAFPNDLQDFYKKNTNASEDPVIYERMKRSPGLGSFILKRAGKIIIRKIVKSGGRHVLRHVTRRFGLGSRSGSRYRRSSLFHSSSRCSVKDCIEANLNCGTNGLTCTTMDYFYGDKDRSEACRVTYAIVCTGGDVYCIACL